jgi:hypothetical protein
MQWMRNRKDGKKMMLNTEERRFLEEVVFSDENRQRDMERWITLMEEDYANESFFCNVA